MQVEADACEVPSAYVRSGAFVVSFDLLCACAVWWCESILRSDFGGSVQIERDGVVLDKSAQATLAANLKSQLLALQHTLDHTRQCKQSCQHANKSNLKRYAL